MIRHLADCTNISKTCVPYVPQLYSLPYQICENITNLQALKSLYISTNPLIFAFAISLFLAPIFLLVSEVNKNYSQVDRCWSILPTVYNAHFTLYAHAAGLPTRRLDSLAIFSALWTVSLPIEQCNVFSLIIPGALDIQLLAQGRLQYRFRRLSMGRVKGEYQSSFVLRF